MALIARSTNVTAEPGGSSAPGLAVRCVNPLEHAADIKRLFVTHGRPEFPAFFDRAYPDAVAAGARSWIGTDSDGQVGAHIMQIPHEFALGRHRVHGGLLANLMVAVPYRTFWPGLGLVRQAVKEARRSGALDFLYADPNDGARALLRAAGLREVGSLQRFVLPLADRRPAIALGIRFYHLVGRLRAGAMPLTTSECQAGANPEPPDLQPLDDPRSLCPIRNASLYRARLSGYPAPHDCWYTFHPAGAGAPPMGRALVRGPDHRGLAEICALQWEPSTVLPSMLIALSRRLRRTGATRLEVSVMAASPAARGLQRAGFLPRADRLPVLAVAFTTRGTEAVAAACDWRILPVDLDR